MRVYSILDRKMREYGSLALAPNDDAAVRALFDGVKGSGATVEKHPRDFDLMCLGDFNPETGALVGELPVLVSGVYEILNPSPSQDGADVAGR